MSEHASLVSLVEKLTDARVICIGDVMLDHFVTGTVSRISPEAPIPVLKIAREDTMLGGAGNVVRNLAALGAKAHVISVINTDDAGQTIRRLIEAEANMTCDFVVEPNRDTSVKTRYIAEGQQMLRTDREDVGNIAAETEAAVLSALEAALPQAEVLILSDYAKGVLTDAVLRGAIDRAKAAGVAVVVDPKSTTLSRYAGATLLTPNRSELVAATQMPCGTDGEVAAAAEAARQAAGVEAFLATRSQDGMTLLPASGAPLHLKAQAREVYDVSGAGDTVIASLAAVMAVGGSLEQAATIANVAAGIVVGKVGTAVVYPDDLSQALFEQDIYDADQKVVTLHQALERVERWRRRGETVAFTNGCFDLIHPGHVSLLRQSKAQADHLILGLNSDASVKRLKGDSRPVQNEAARATVLASFEAVDMVVIFDEDTPMKLIEAILPDVLVKGADYTVETVVGGEVVMANGGRVHLADLKAGHSTTGTIARMTGDDAAAAKAAAEKGSTQA